MKFFIRTAQVILIVAGIALIALPREWLPSYYKPLPMGLVAIGFSFLINLASWVLPRFRNHPTLLAFQCILATDLILSGIGSLGAWGLYRYGFAYDKLVHFIFSATMMYFIGRVVLLWKNVRATPALIILALIVSLCGVVWELIEYVFAAYFHLGLFGTLFDHDSRRDILINITGVLVAVGALGFSMRTKRSGV